ncbi:MAG: hypothetical protein KKB50_16675 [Planctomycetes bacterium]|nr:hypothetical protein [Planctomycetota bacterium]
MAKNDTGVADQTTLAERATRRTLSHRRWRVWRMIAIFVIATATMITLSMANRDAQSVRTCQTNLRYALDVFRSEHKGKPLPWTLPMPHAERDLLRSHYRYAPQNANLLDTYSPVGICWCDQPHHLFLRPSGRHLLLFDGEEYEIRWMSEAEFRTNAARFGLNIQSKR